MKITVTDPIIGYDGDPFEELNVDTNERRGLDLRWAIRSALNTPVEKLPFTPELLVTCGKLSRRVCTDDIVDLTAKEITMILDRAAHVQARAQWGPMVYLALVEKLDPEIEPEATDA